MGGHKLGESTNNLQDAGGRNQIWSVFPRRFRISAHSSGHLLTTVVQTTSRRLSGKIQPRNPMQAASAACKNRSLRNRSAWREAQGETPGRGQVMDQEQPRLPDGRRLLFKVQGVSLPRLNAQERAVARDPDHTSSNNSTEDIRLGEKSPFIPCFQAGGFLA